MVCYCRATAVVTSSDVNFWKLLDEGFYKLYSFLAVQQEALYSSTVTVSKYVN